MPLSQRIIDTTPTPKTGFKELRDHGLVVRIHPTGKRSFSYEYRSPLTKKSARVGLPVSTLAEARTAVLKHKLTLGEDRDPNAERKHAVTARGSNSRAIRTSAKRFVSMSSTLCVAQRRLRVASAWRGFAAQSNHSTIARPHL